MKPSSAALMALREGHCTIASCCSAVYLELSVVYKWLDVGISRAKKTYETEQSTRSYTANRECDFNRKYVFLCSIVTKFVFKLNF